ncbi:hypothetical protein OPV22_001546 [Ensete ventricosum]|uniref:Uncharacterized protein n=1 Tax=Ensete ventricosum TaxID=4639 RepID=A0AAV8RUL1_ENSVE|nr:hypothetical protein OPV22_001546 [Ensete ventricosum]
MDESLSVTSPPNTFNTRSREGGADHVVIGGYFQEARRISRVSWLAFSYIAPLVSYRHVEPPPLRVLRLAH